jgi:hypothetical protein
VSIDKTLNERGSRYGKFAGQAQLSQSLKHEMKMHPNYKMLSVDQKEALEMIQHKVARIINGDPTYSDSWRDIAGYATLVEKMLEGESI